MKLKSINTTGKAEKKIQAISKNNNLDDELVYFIISFYWNYDGVEGTWVREVDKDTDYRERTGFICEKLKLSGNVISKEEAVNEIYKELSIKNIATLNAAFTVGAKAKNYCSVSEYASFYYLTNATVEKLNMLEWGSEGFDAENIIYNIFLKIFRGGAVDRYNLKYLYSDLIIEMPYQNVKTEPSYWIEEFVEKVMAKKPKLKLSDLLAMLKEFCKGDKYFLQTVLEALSYSGILKVENYPVNDIFIPDNRDKLSSHFNANEWTFPLRFWKS